MDGPQTFRWIPPSLRGAVKKYIIADIFIKGGGGEGWQNPCPLSFFGGGNNAWNL